MTARGPSVGVRVPQYGATWPEILRFAERAERHGFAGLWVNDHLQAPGRIKTEATFDAFTTLAALAATTRAPRLGVAVLSASYRRAPLAAKMATVIDVISRGRLVVGLGTGSDRAEHEAYGIPFAAAAERAEGVAAALETMRAMFAAPEGANLPGALRNAPNLPAPVQEGGPPVWLAAHRPRLLRLAGERADGIVAAFVGPDEVARRLARADEARRAAGRPPLACALYTFALPVPSRAEADAWLTPYADLLGTTVTGLMRWLRGTGIVAPPDELRDRLAEFGRAGVTDAVLVLPSHVPPEALDALAEAALEVDGQLADRSTANWPTGARPPSGRPADNLVTLLVERHAEADGDRPAAVEDAGTWSFADLSRASARAAGGLAEAGVRRGDRVALPLRDGRRWMAAFLGAARMGAVPVPLDPGAPRERLVAVLEDCEPAAVVIEDAGAVPAWARAVTPAELDAGPPAPVAGVHPEDLAYLIYSSGSTGRPKGAMHAHRDLRVGIETYAREVLALGPDDRCHSMARLFTSLGFGNGFFRIIGSGATAVLSGTLPTPRAVLGTVERHGVTILTAVPTFWAQLTRFLERHPQPDALASVRLAVSSGDSLPAPIAARLREVTGLELIEGLGCSECSNVVISTRPGEPLPGTLGRAVEGIELRLADDEGRPVPDGEPGRLWIRSDSNTTGYWRRSAETRELVFGPWVRMGDVLSRTDGVYRHLGRADDLFKVDARWVSPTQVEAALLDHPAVQEAAVVGREGDDGLVRAAAFVVLAEDDGVPDDLEEVLRRHVAHRLEPHAAPRSVTVLEALPRLPGGKLDRRSLREGT
jgi:acyl-coenzyme A synthetase/AMP-(fatty) acid ligase/alkanesulfonate monooxygenase SsuD/methylene tetrahydromethanopterin reductase-like flavin-dependent oxidoreductase (luciferase family)